MISLFNRYPVLEKVIVNTKTGRTFRGMLWERKRGHLVLRGVEMLAGKGEAVPVDGEVLIPAENVDFIQVV